MYHRMSFDQFPEGALNHVCLHGESSNKSKRFGIFNFISKPSSTPNN
jgi:hypothetical protein